MKTPLRGRGAACLAAFLILSGCFQIDSGSGGGDARSAAYGMRSIAARGRAFSQGSDGPLAGPDEKPVLTASFGHDFALDTAEVTQGSFRRLMGRDPSAAAYGSGDAYPAYNVTWFDAAVYCNRRGLEAGLDTVYEYSAVERNAQGAIYGLPGLAIHLDRRGFRLPLESEWEFAARGGAEGEFPWGEAGDSASAAGFAWYARNAGGTSHPVAGLRPNGFGLYDMAGNVMEWVNDWKGAYPAAGGEDYAGAHDPGPAGDMPVKGGSFKHGLRELRPANRSATYATIPSASAEYVGFRCALGAVAHPRFSTPEGNLVEGEAPSVDATALRGLAGGRAAKLVFVSAAQNRRRLFFADLSQASQAAPAPREFADVDNVFYPVISPDGNWVAFGTALEGADKGSSIFLRALDGSASPARLLGEGFIPRWWVDPAARDTFLVYASSAVDNTDPRWGTSRTLMVKIQAGAPAGEPSVLVSDGGFHDGRSRDGRWLATGYRRLLQRDLQSGKTRVLFTAPQNGKGDGDTSQVCNVSVSPDSSGRTLFLDFGSPSVSRLTGTRYNVHEMAFIADASGQVTRWLRVPEGEEGWEDLEWSNRPDYAVSAAADAAGRRQHLYLLDLKDSACARIATGSLLADPGLWLGAAPEAVSGDLNPDSLGHYNDPAANEPQAIFSDKMKKFWGRHADWELIAVGSSHVQDGIDPRRFSRLRAFNLGVSTLGVLGANTLVLDYILNHAPKLKVLIVEFFPGIMILSDGDDVWKPVIARTKGVAYDQSHGFWKTGLPPHFEEAMARAPEAALPWIDSVGTVSQSSGGWGAAPLPTELRNDWTAADPVYRENFARVEAMARAVSARKIHLVLVNFPQSPGYKTTGYYQKQGPGWQAAADVVAQAKGLEAISPYIHFYDAYDFGNHDYSADEAHDADHLSAKGAAKLTVRLDSLVNAFP
jgi:uncharacterized protein (TIGR02171 family)